MSFPCLPITHIPTPSSNDGSQLTSSRKPQINSTPPGLLLWVASAFRYCYTKAKMWSVNSNTKKLTSTKLFLHPKEWSISYNTLLTWLIRKHPIQQMPSLISWYLSLALYYFICQEVLNSSQSLHPIRKQKLYFSAYHLFPFKSIVNVVVGHFLFYYLFSAHNPQIKISKSSSRKAAALVHTYHNFLYSKRKKLWTYLATKLFPRLKGFPTSMILNQILLHQND